MWPLMTVIAKKIVAICVVLAGVTLFPARGMAIDLGLTPTQVFSIWTGINESLLVIARAVSDDATWHRELSGIRPRTFQDKFPADVLEQLAAYRAKLDRLRRGAGLKPIRIFVGDDRPVTPTVVYLNSGLVLNGQVEWLIRNSSRRQLVSQFYPNYYRADSGERTPSQVYALVKLANRRLARILTRAGAPNSAVPAGAMTP